MNSKLLRLGFPRLVLNGFICFVQWNSDNQTLLGETNWYHVWCNIPLWHHAAASWKGLKILEHGCQNLNVALNLCCVTNHCHNKFTLKVVLFNITFKVAGFSSQHFPAVIFWQIKTTTLNQEMSHIACIAWRFLSNLRALGKRGSHNVKRQSHKEPGRETTEKHRSFLPLCALAKLSRLHDLLPELFIGFLARQFGQVWNVRPTSHETD